MFMGCSECTRSTGLDLRCSGLVDVLEQKSFVVRRLVLRCLELSEYSRKSHFLDLAERSWSRGRRGWGERAFLGRLDKWERLLKELGWLDMIWG